MTAITIDLRTDTPGGPAATTGVLVARRTRIRIDGSVITYPTRLSFALPGPVHLDAPPLGEAWILELWVTGVGLIASRTVVFSGDTAAWADLTDVDPATLQPGTEPATAGTGTVTTAGSITALSTAAATGTGTVLASGVSIQSRMRYGTRRVIAARYRGRAALTIYRGHTRVFP